MKELKFNFSKASLKKAFAFMLVICLCMTSVEPYLAAGDGTALFSSEERSTGGGGVV